MQAVPAGAVYPSILPGPFILLLALPAIPLLLFSIGARPPDTSSLPFSTDDLWQTTAFITLAGGVVLAVGLYPGVLGDVGKWVAEGGGDGWAERWLGGEGVGVRLAQAPVQVQAQGSSHGFQAQAQSQHMRSPPIHPMRPQYAPQHGGQQQFWTDRPKTRTKVINRPPQIVQDRAGNKWWRKGGKVRVEVPVEDIPVVILPEPLESRQYPSLASRHLAHLREGILAPWYSPTRPSTPLALLVVFVIIMMLIVVVGKILGDKYDTESKSNKGRSSSGSGRGKSDREGEEEEPWYVRELSKRKNEPREATVKRSDEQNKEFVGRLKKMKGVKREAEVKKRKGEMDKLKAELKKRKMPMVGLDWDYGDGKTRGKSIDKPKNKDSKKRKVGSQEVEPDKTKAVGAVDKARAAGESVKSKMKGIFGGGKDSSTSSAAAPSPAGGPGWTPADDAVAHAAIRGGSARAENMANSLVARK